MQLDRVRLYLHMLSKTGSVKKIRSFRYLIILALALFLLNCQTTPDGISFQGERFATNEIAFVSDTTWTDPDGNRQVEQALFDKVFQIIAAAKKLIVVDMFLYNDFQGPTPETTRALASDLTNALIAQKTNYPDIQIVVITDPVNELYGGRPSANFNRLRTAEIPVVTTNLRELRDSNRAYSLFWRALIKPFGNKPATTLKSPIGPGRVSLRTYLELINFKANHRKVLIADQGDDFVGFVSSANPHDGSSAHRNAAISFTGPAVTELLVTENVVLTLSGKPPIDLDRFGLVGTETPQPPAPSDTTLQIVTERKIKEAILTNLDRTSAGDKVALMMFYLSDRDIVKALKRARSRDVNLRVLLDPNKDAFGREKNGIPNRSVAHELTKADVLVRWCETQGEQCHAKMLVIHTTDGRAVIITGSANFTRRNLDDYNLETDVVVEGKSDTAPFTNALDHFDVAWNNTADRQYSVEYDHYKDESLWHRVIYRVMEWSGISTF